MFFYTVMKTPIVYLLFIVVSYLSCSPRPQSPADIHTDLSNNKILQLSELFDGIRYIPLETPDTALIANVQAITYHNGRYYLIAENTLYVFNRHGQYLSQHNNQGRGANEYNSIFQVKSSIGDSVLYVSGDNGKGHIVMAYDRNGNYLKTLIQNRSFNMEFNVLENSIIISDGRTVSLYDKQGKLENEIRISPFDSISFGTSNHLSDFSSQEVIFSCPGSDTLYFLGKSGITRKISLDYGHNQSPEQFKKSLSNPITFPYFHNFISLGKTVLDLIVIDQKQYMIQMDLTRRTATVCDTLVNDIDHTIPYIPREIVENQGLMVLPAPVFFHFIQPEQLSAIPALRNLTEDANPVIVVLNLKSSSL